MLPAATDLGRYPGKTHCSLVAGYSKCLNQCTEIALQKMIEFLSKPGIDLVLGLVLVC